MSYQGFYINLDRSTDRRAEIEAELARAGLRERYQRLRAVEGNEPHLASSLKNENEIGCFLSHVATLKEGHKTSKHIHIVEDDTIFAPCTGATLEWAIASGALRDYDILYTDIALPLSSESYRYFKPRYDRAVMRDGDGNITRAAFEVFDLRDTPFTAASSYLVNTDSVEKLIRLYDTEIAEGIRVPVDEFLKLQAQVGAIKSGCLFPFVTSVRIAHTLTSTIRHQPDTTRRFTAANIARYSFFIGCDWDECARLMKEYLPQPAVANRHTELLARLLAFSLTDGSASS